MLLKRGKFGLVGAVMAGLSMASFLAPAAVAADEPQEQIKTKSNISRVVGPGEKGWALVGCGDSKWHIKEVSAQVSGSAVSYAPTSFNPRNEFKPLELKTGQKPNEARLEFENTGDKRARYPHRVTFWVAITVTCSTVAPEKPMGGQLTLSDEIMIPGSTIFGNGTATGIVRCPTSHPNYKGVTVNEHPGVSYSKTIHTGNPDYVTFEFTNTNPREHMDVGAPMYMDLVCEA
ncbi:hypothetical protein [Streptomyces sp. NPDC088752]|uniref:hypothetical protein n=1 Tax=Streptomyces sp. NPDC088752 TaxID=3154963 RepID=UPI0034165739